MAQGQRHRQPGDDAEDGERGPGAGPEVRLRLLHPVPLSGRCAPSPLTLRETARSYQRRCGAPPWRRAGPARAPGGRVARARRGPPSRNALGPPWPFREEEDCVGARGFEPPTSRTRTVRSTKLSYAPEGAALRVPPFRRVTVTSGRDGRGRESAGGADYRPGRHPVKRPCGRISARSGRACLMSIRTLAELFQVVAAHDKPACLMHKVDGRYVSISTARVRHRGAPGRQGPGAGRREAGRPRRADGREQPPLADDRLRDAGDRRRAGADLSDAAARGRRLRRARQRLAHPLRAGPRAPRRAARPARRDAGRRAHRAARRGGARARRRGLRGLPRPGFRRDHRGVRRLGRARPSRGPRHADLHQRHHRRSEGRDAHPRQPGLQRRHRLPAPRPRGALRRALLPAALALLRAHGRLLLLLPRRDDRLRRVGPDRRRRTCSRSGPTSSSRCRASTRR